MIDIGGHSPIRAKNYLKTTVIVDPVIQIYKKYS